MRPTCTLISEFLSAIRANTSLEYTIDGLLVADDDTAYAIVYDAGSSAYYVASVKRNPETVTVGDIDYGTQGDALEALTDAVEEHN